MTIGMRTKRRAAPRRGPTNSQDFDAFQDEVASDLGVLVTEINAQGAEIDRDRLIGYHEAASTSAQVERFIEDQETRNLFDAEDGNPITVPVNFRSFRGANYEINFGPLAEARRLRMEPLYGQVILPLNQAVNRVYGVNPDTGLPVLPGTVETEVVGYNDSTGTAVPGTQKYAVNGMNQDYWIRQVRFPVSSDVDYVEATYQLNLPAGHTTHVNTLSLHPFPAHQIDVTEFLYSTTTADPALVLPGFTAMTCAGATRWHLTDIAMTKVRVRIRQRHFVNQNGFKVFHLGIQELMLQLLDFDRTANPVSGPLGPSVGNGMVIEVIAPAGHPFDSVTRFWSDPAWATGALDNGVHWRIYSDPLLTTEQWSSWADPAPQDTAVDLSALNLSTLYLVLTMEWDAGNNMSPVANRCGIQFSTQ